MDVDLIADVTGCRAYTTREDFKSFITLALMTANRVRLVSRRVRFFTAVRLTVQNVRRPDGKPCGCLIEIKYPQYPTGERFAWTDEWTLAVREDERIPWSLGYLAPENLWAFAEWQQTFRDYFRREGYPEPWWQKRTEGNFSDC